MKVKARRLWIQSCLKRHHRPSQTHRHKKNAPCAFFLSTFFFNPFVFVCERAQETRPPPADRTACRDSAQSRAPLLHGTTPYDKGALRSWHRTYPPQQKCAPLTESANRASPLDSRCRPTFPDGTARQAARLAGTEFL